jgi:hypothetical protein
MKKLRENRNKEIILEFLNTKFNNCKLRTEVSRYNETYTMYYLDNTLVMESWMRGKEYRGNFEKRFLQEFTSWFPNIKYKRRVLRDWFFTNYNPILPEGCIVYVP